MAMIGSPDNVPDFLMSVHQCRDCETDPPECTDEIKRTCPFYHIRKIRKMAHADTRVSELMH